MSSARASAMLGLCCVFVTLLTYEGQGFSAELYCCEVTNVMLSVVFVLRLICADQSLNVQELLKSCNVVKL